MYNHLEFVTTTVLSKNLKYCEFPTQFQKITDTVSLFQCNVNGTSRDLRVTGWSVAETQYFQAAYFAGSFIMQLPGGYLATRYSPRRYIMYMSPPPPIPRAHKKLATTACIIYFFLLPGLHLHFTWTYICYNIDLILCA